MTAQEFADWYVEHQQEVLAVARVLTGNEADAQDAVMSALAVAFASKWYEKSVGDERGPGVWARLALDIRGYARNTRRGAGRRKTAFKALRQSRGNGTKWTQAAPNPDDAGPSMGGG